MEEEENLQDRFSQRCLQNLQEKWEKAAAKLQDLLNSCIAFEDIKQEIEGVKDGLNKVVEELSWCMEDSAKGHYIIQSCKNQMKNLSDVIFKMKQQVEETSKIDLVYDSKQEIIKLYSKWNEVHEKVANTEEKQIKFEYSKRLTNPINITHKSSDEENISDEEEPLTDKLNRLRRELTILKTQMMSTTTQPTPRKGNYSRWTNFSSKISFNIFFFLIFSFIFFQLGSKTSHHRPPI